MLVATTSRIDIHDSAFNGQITNADFRAFQGSPGKFCWGVSAVHQQLLLPQGLAQAACDPKLPAA